MTARPGAAPGQAAHAAACAHEGIDDADEVAELWQGLGDSGRAHWADVSQAAVTEFIDERATIAAAAAQPASGDVAARRALEEAVEHAIQVTPAGSGTAAVMRAVDAYVFARTRAGQPAPAAAPGLAEVAYGLPAVDALVAALNKKITEAEAERDRYHAALGEIARNDGHDLARDHNAEIARRALEGK